MVDVIWTLVMLLLCALGVASIYTRVSLILGGSSQSSFSGIIGLLVVVVLCFIVLRWGEKRRAQLEQRLKVLEDERKRLEKQVAQLLDQAPCEFCGVIKPSSELIRDGEICLCEDCAKEK